MLDKLSAVSFVANPYPYYHQVRSADPIHWNPAIRSWTVTSYTHVLHALRHQHLSSQRPKPDLDHLSKSSRQIADAFYDTLSSWLLRSDPPHHTRLRQLAAQSFSKPLLERMQGEAHRTAQHLMNIVEPLGRIEVISDFAAPLSLSVISHLIGIPSQDRTRFARWLDEIGAAAEAAADATKLALGHASLLKAVDYLRNLISRRLQQPQLDLLSSFLSTEFSADRLAEQEVISIILLLLMAGRDTATHALGNGVLNLLKNPEQLERLRRDKSLSTNAVQELVRYDTPLQGLLRTASEDLELGGKQVRQGETVLVWLGAANRDPAQFPDPDRLDITRKAGHHVGFGHGVHYCLGASLGVLILEVGIATLLERAPRLRLASTVVEWEGNLLFRCQRALAAAF